MDGNWKNAADIKVGDMLSLIDGTIEVIKVEKAKSKVSVFNLTVENAHTFYVANTGVLTHNTNKNCKIPVRGGAYTLVRATNIGGEVHHMPAKSAVTTKGVTPVLSEYSAPSIWMETVDHKKTRSHSNSAYVQQQKSYCLKTVGVLLLTWMSQMF